MRNNVLYNGTLTTDQVVRVDIKVSALLKVSGSAFSATLQSLDIDSEASRSDSDYSDLAPAVTLTETANYQQTLGKGFYALKFASSTGTIKVLVAK